MTVRTYHTGILRKRIFPVHILPDEEYDNHACLFLLELDTHANIHRSTPPSSSTEFPSDTDIRAILTSRQAEGAPRVRPRGTGKLLSSCHGVGLALLRLEHVAAFENGHTTLEFEVQSEVDGTSTKWSVNPWRPDWWPSLPSSHE